MAQNGIKVIIDTDTGIDDAMALFLALKSPEIEVVGLTTVFGNGHVDACTRNALRVLEMAGRPDVPVAKGAALPLVVPLYVADFVHGEDALGNTNLPPPSGSPVDVPAAQFIVETVMGSPGEITLMPIGPLTNLALALRLEPQIAENVREVIMMGGSAMAGGNASPAAEANTGHDPHASHVVFSAGWPITMVGLDVTQQTITTDGFMEGLREAGEAGKEVPGFIYRMTRFYRHNQFRPHYDRMGGFYTHDPSAIAFAIDPTLFETWRVPIRVVTEGAAAGMTLPDRNGEWEVSRPVDVCVKMDSARFFELYRERLLSYG